MPWLSRPQAPRALAAALGLTCCAAWNALAASRIAAPQSSSCCCTKAFQSAVTWPASSHMLSAGWLGIQQSEHHFPPHWEQLTHSAVPKCDPLASSSCAWVVGHANYGWVAGGCGKAAGGGGWRAGGERRRAAGGQSKLPA